MLDLEVSSKQQAQYFSNKNKDIHTPIPDCFLNGITRQTVIEMVKNQGFNIIERHIKPDEMKILMKF